MKRGWIAYKKFKKPGNPKIKKFIIFRKAFSSEIVGSKGESALRKSRRNKAISLMQWNSYSKTEQIPSTESRSFHDLMKSKPPLPKHSHFYQNRE